ncbi:MAG: hypothetical protein HON70_36500, partial [Lentisphaerae bacterium]|nr:hypothetical protein [Lentisphaerota bacterium]
IELVLRAADSARSGITVEGEGQSVSNLLCDSPGGLFRLVDPACATQFNLRDFSIVARQENCGTALDFGSPGRGARNYRTLTIENVDIRGDNVYRSNYFSVGLDATGHWRPLFRNLVVHSSRQRGTDRPAPDNSTGGACGVRADWCYAPAFEHCYVWGTRTGYSILCRNAPEGPEDASFIRCTAVGCAVGIDIDTPIPEPQLLITGCHINCTEVGIRLRNRKFFTITDNLMYSAVPSETPYTDILVSGRSHCGLITGNIFHFAGRDVYRADPQSARVNVHITSDIRDVTVANNIFNAKGTTVLIESGARRVKADDNGIANAHAKPSKN